MSNLVTITEHDTHMLLTMDDGKANALGFEMFDAINSSLDTVAEANKVVVITGRPGRFSAGFDLSVMKRVDESTVRLLRTGAEFSRRLLTFETPVLLAVSGHALAMGALTLLSADYRIGVRGDFKIGLNEVAISMTLPWFGVELARDRLATAHFGPSVGLAKICDPDAAVAAGFLDEAVDEASFWDRVNATAAGLAQLDMPSHSASKLRIREPLFERLDEAFRRDFPGA